MSEPKPEGDDARAQRKTLVGVVRTAKMDKTRRVEVPRLQRHPKYGKYIQKRTICYMHDEKNETKVGDTVEMMETRPTSKMKRWRFLRVVMAAPVGSEVEVASGGGA